MYKHLLRLLISKIGTGAYCPDFTVVQEQSMTMQFTWCSPYDSTYSYTPSDQGCVGIHICTLICSSYFQSYLEAGADFVETNTFNGTAVSQSDYGTQHLVRTTLHIA